MQELDPATGKAKWTKTFPKGWKVARTYSVDPVVLYLTNEDKKQWNVTTLKNDGTRPLRGRRRRVLRARVRLGHPRP